METTESLLRQQGREAMIAPGSNSRIAAQFARLAREDKSPVVRLYLASAMQRLPVDDRWEVIEALRACRGGRRPARDPECGEAYNSLHMSAGGCNIRSRL